MKSANARVAIPGMVLLAVVGTAAAQPAPSVLLRANWRAWPSGLSNVLLFQDSAEVWIDAVVSPSVGSAVVYTSPPGTGVGTVAALGSITFEVRGCDVPAGTWTLSGAGFHGTTGTTFGLRNGWGVGSAGAGQAGGHVTGCQGGQPFFGVGPPNAANPVSEIWRGRWAYSTFEPGRWLRFSVIPLSASVWVQYDTQNGQPVYTQVSCAVSASAPVEVFMDSGPPPPCWFSVSVPPQDATVYAGDPVSFSVGIQSTGTGCGTPSYRWRRECAQLSDGGPVSGATSATLTISPVASADAGRYDVLVAGNHSSTALLTVLCYPNCDGSTAAPALNVGDFACFLQRFASGDPYANCDRSTAAPVLNVADFTCFLQRFAAGCS